MSTLRDTAAPKPAANSPGDPYRVMVVDDSAVVRGLVSRMLESDPQIQVICSVSNGQMALSSLERYDIEVVVLDIEMPVMDGLTALPKLLEIDRNLQIIMASTLTLHNADISLRAIEMGAADYVPKPTTSKELTGTADFKRDLLEKVKALGQTRRRLPPVRKKAPSERPAAKTVAPGAAPAPKPLYPAGPITLRQPAAEVPDLIAIGSSTGGPQALFTVLTAMKQGNIKQPIMITQHMPATFTTILAEHITRLSGWEAAEGKDGEPIKGGRIYIAPGDFHMIAEQKGTERVIRLNKNPPENFCRPAVDPMFRSLSAIYGRRLLCAILTGMGSDGSKGGKVVVEAGGTVIAQDEATSVVWGMPGAAATSGICSAILPVNEIGPYLVRLANKLPVAR